MCCLAAVIMCLFSACLCANLFFLSYTIQAGFSPPPPANSFQLSSLYVEHISRGSRFLSYWKQELNACLCRVQQSLCTVSFGKVTRNGLGVRGSEAVICQYFPTNGNSVCDSKVGVTRPDNFRLWRATGGSFTNSLTHLPCVNLWNAEKPVIFLRQGNVVASTNRKGAE